MRKPLVAVVAGLFLQLALPAPAQAWWELLEELSGPENSRLGRPAPIALCDRNTHV